MKVSLIKHDEFTTSEWSGGKTTQMAIFPRTSVYLNRDFIWRISSATCELEESDFSKLPDFDRVLMVLKGQVILNYNGEKTVKLKELEQDSFDGGWKTKSYGKITDFNLMVRKGGKGYVDLIYPKEDSIVLSSEKDTGLKENLLMPTHALFVKEGYIIANYGVTDDEGNARLESKLVNEGELLILEGEGGENFEYSLMGEGVTVRSMIYYEGDSEIIGPEYIPSEKATFDDFRCSLFLANTQFHGAKYIFRRLNHIWLDEELQAAVTKLEKYCATLCAFIVGTLIVMSVTYKCGYSDKEIMWWILAWIVVDCLLVSPLIFFFALPKPVRKHIKDVDKLTPYERKVREYNLNRNERTEKIIRRYSRKYSEDPIRIKDIFKKKK